MSHVSIVLFRGWLKYVISDGLYIAQGNLGRLYVEHLYIFPHRS